MADDEEEIDIDIDVDIDGDEPEDQAQDVATRQNRTEERDLPTTLRVDSMVDLSENVDDTINHKEDVSKRRVGIKVFNMDNMK